MTEQTRNRKLVVFLFFSFVVAFFTFFAYAILTQKYVDPRWKQLRFAQATQAIVHPQKKSYPLQIDKVNTIDNLKITYRGLESNTLILDLVIIDLDPEYAYRRRIPIDEAKEGFYLSGQAFVVKRVGSFRIDIARRSD